MLDLSPESIEAIDPTDLQKVKQTAYSLHESTTGMLETPLPSAEIERQRNLRSAMKIKLKEARGKLKGQIADLEAIGRDLGTVLGWTTSDESRLESYFFSILREEKRGNA